MWAALTRAFLHRFTADIKVYFKEQSYIAGKLFFI
jgi:hypothetical protein